MGERISDGGKSGGVNLEAGDTYANRYSVIEALREGGSAQIYAAHDDLNDRDVALKVLREEGMKGGDYASLVFRAEVEILESLRHPHIVELIDWGTTPGRHIALELLQEDLFDRQRDQLRWSWDEFWDDIGQPVLEALSAAHAKKHVHRDISPYNIMFADDGTAKLIDFGLAKTMDTERRDVPGRHLTTSVLCTVPFALSGEDAYGPHGASRDVYGFAAVAVSCLTLISADLESVDDLEAALARIEVSDEIRGFLGRCLCRDPNERPTGPAEVLASLRAASERGRQQKEADHPVGLWLVVGDHRADKIAASLRVPRDVLEDRIHGDLDAGIALLPHRREGAIAPGELAAFGTDFSYHLRAHTNRGYIEVLNAWRLDDPIKIAHDRNRAACPSTKIFVGHPSSPEAAGKVLASLVEHVLDVCAPAGIDGAAGDEQEPFRTWAELLKYRNDIQESLKQGVPFANRSVKNGQILLSTVERPEGFVSGDQVVLVAESGESVLWGEVVGVSDSGLLVARTRGGMPDQLARQGRVRIETGASQVALKRQRDALAAVRSGTSLRGDLGVLLADPSRVRAPRPVDLDPQTGAGLDEAQAAAVRLALGSPDFSCVSGPPGTGKTAFIAALVAETLRENPHARILVTSQTNVAVDNALERIHAQSPTLRLVRVGNAASQRVSAAAEEWLVERQVEAWKSEVREAAHRFVSARADAAGLDAAKVGIAMDLDELAAFGGEVERLQEQMGLLKSEATAGEGPPEVESARGSTRETAAEGQAAARRITRAEVADEISAYEDEIARRKRDYGNHLDRIVGRAGAPPRRQLEQSDPAQLRAMAALLVTGPRKALEDLRRIIAFQGEWLGCFGDSAEFEAAVIRRAQVVGATCVGLAGSPAYEGLAFDLCIIDEASRATPTEALVPIVRARKAVLVGDLQQLPPFVEQVLTSPNSLSDRDLTDESLSETLFAYLDRSLPEKCKAHLSVQYRMAPAIGELISQTFYEGRLVNGRERRRSPVDAIHGAAVTWLTTSGLADKDEVRRRTSFENPCEVQSVCRLLRRIAYVNASAPGDLSIGILSGYQAQCTAIESAIAREAGGLAGLNVEVGTVDSVQGRQFDVVVYSVTRSNIRGENGFLRDRRRMNVALSRARDHLVIVGDHRFCGALPDDPLADVLRFIEVAEGCQLVFDDGGDT